jgi:hypothetical protein
MQELGEAHSLSINHLMDGKPKMWFVVHPNNRDENAIGLRKLITKEYKECNQYHRHKTIFVDPVKVQVIPVYKMCKGQVIWW